VRTFSYPAHINAIVEFLPQLLQHVRCDGVHSTSDSVSEILRRWGQWAYINHVLHVPPQEEIKWIMPGDRGGHRRKRASSPAARPIHRLPVGNGTRKERDIQNENMRATLGICIRFAFHHQKLTEIYSLFYRINQELLIVLDMTV
jgi:hypothetical protein